MFSSIFKTEIFFVATLILLSAIALNLVKSKYGLVGTAAVWLEFWYYLIALNKGSRQGFYVRKKNRMQSAFEYNLF